MDLGRSNARMSFRLRYWRPANRTGWPRRLRWPSGCRGHIAACLTLGHRVPLRMPGRSGPANGRSITTIPSARADEIAAAGLWGPPCFGERPRYQSDRRGAPPPNGLAVQGARRSVGPQNFRDGDVIALEFTGVLPGQPGCRPLACS